MSSIHSKHNITPGWIYSTITLTELPACTFIVYNFVITYILSWCRLIQLLTFNDQTSVKFYARGFTHWKRTHATALSQAGIDTHSSCTTTLNQLWKHQLQEQAKATSDRVHSCALLLRIAQAEKDQRRITLLETLQAQEKAFKDDSSDLTARIQATQDSVIKDAFPKPLPGTILETLFSGLDKNDVETPRVKFFVKRMALQQLDIKVKIDALKAKISKDFEKFTPPEHHLKALDALMISQLENPEAILKEIDFIAQKAEAELLLKKGRLNEALVKYKTLNLPEIVREIEALQKLLPCSDLTTLDLQATKLVHEFETYLKQYQPHDEVSLFLQAEGKSLGEKLSSRIEKEEDHPELVAHEEALQKIGISIKTVAIFKLLKLQKICDRIKHLQAQHEIFQKIKQFEEAAEQALAKKQLEQALSLLTQAEEAAEGLPALQEGLRNRKAAYQEIAKIADVEIDLKVHQEKLDKIYGAIDKKIYYFNPLVKLLKIYKLLIGINTSIDFATLKKLIRDADNIVIELIIQGMTVSKPIGKVDPLYCLSPEYRLKCAKALIDELLDRMLDSVAVFHNNISNRATTYQQTVDELESRLLDGELFENLMLLFKLSPYHVNKEIIALIKKLKQEPLSNEDFSPILSSLNPLHTVLRDVTKFVEPTVDPAFTLFKRKRLLIEALIKYISEFQTHWRAHVVRTLSQQAVNKESAEKYLNTLSRQGLAELTKQYWNLKDKDRPAAQKLLFP